MPQYIQNPALIGAQMADDLSKQRMNLVGQAVVQATDAINKQTAIDAAAQLDLARTGALLKAGISPTGNALPETYSPPNYDWDIAVRKLLADRAASREGIDPTQSPTSSMYRIGLSRAGAAEVPYNMRGVKGYYGAVPPTNAEILTQGRAAITPAQVRYLQNQKSVDLGGSPNIWRQFINAIGLGE
jgi:hypothetical protein